MPKARFGGVSPQALSEMRARQWEQEPLCGNLDVLGGSKETKMYEPSPLYKEFAETGKLPSFVSRDGKGVQETRLVWFVDGYVLRTMNYPSHLSYEEGTRIMELPILPYFAELILSAHAKAKGA